MRMLITPELTLPVPRTVCGNEVRYEFLDGQWVEMSPRSAYAARIASRLVRKLGDHNGA